MQEEPRQLQELQAAALAAVPIVGTHTASDVTYPSLCSCTALLGYSKMFLRAELEKTAGRPHSRPRAVSLPATPKRADWPRTETLVRLNYTCIFESVVSKTRKTCPRERTSIENARMRTMRFVQSISSQGQLGLHVHFDFLERRGLSSSDSAVA